VAQAPPADAPPPEDAAGEAAPRPVLAPAPAEPIAAEPAAPPAKRSALQLAGAVGWNALIVFAILLALAALGLALAGALGAQL
jgi:hypothetical protein